MCFEVFPNSPELGIRIDLDDSCNCCYGKNGGNKSTTKMYINSAGIAVKFDKKKSQDGELSRMRSFSHLRTLIDQNVEGSTHTRQEFYSYLAEEVFVEMNPEAPPPITLGFIQKINVAIRDIFSN